MSALSLFKISGHFRGNVNFFPTTNVLLTPKNSICLSKVFLSSVNETRIDFLQNIPFKRKYYLQYLLSNSQFKNLIFSLQPKTITKAGEMLNQLKQEGEDDLKLRNQLSEHLNEKLSQFSFDELCEVKSLVQEFVNQTKDDPFWGKILENINGECVNRIPSWTSDEIIKVAEISMRVQKFSNIKNKLVNKLIKRFLTNQQTILLFYFFLNKRFHISKEYNFKMQKKALSILPDINSIEIGIIAEGLLNSFSYLHIRDIFHYLPKRCLDEKETIDQVPFNSIIKLLRVFSNLKDQETLAEFQGKAIETALKFGTKEVIALAFLSVNISYLDSSLRTVLMKEVKDHITELPIFQIERVTFINTKFNIRDEEFLNLAVDAFESNKFAKNFTASVLFLSHLIHYEMYPKKLLHLALEQQFVDDLLGKKMSTKCNWWFIYCSLELEKPEYLTINLDPKIRKKLCILSKIHFQLNFPKHNSYLWKTNTILSEVYGEEMVKVFLPLPHYPCGLLMRADKNLKMQKLPQELVYCNNGFVIKPLQDDSIWMFIVFEYSSNLYLKTESNFISRTQFRQLKSVGYTPILVHGIKRENQREYLESLINATLEECCKGQKDEITN